MMQDQAIEYTECLHEGTFMRDMRNSLEATLADTAPPNTIRFLVVVVLYGTELQMSETIKRLRTLPDRASRSISILIWNNGPRPFISKTDAPHDSILVNAIGNIPLGIVYNHALSLNDLFDVFVIFDQDTDFATAFFDEIEEAMHAGLHTLAIPTSMSRDIIVSPVLRNYKPCNVIKPGLFDGSTYTAIGSGMVIPRSLAAECRFTTELQFYGVDHHFFQLAAKRNMIMLLPSIQKHSISTREKPLFDSDFKARSLIHSVYFNNLHESGPVLAFLASSKMILREAVRAKSLIGLFKYMAYLILTSVLVASDTKRR